MRLGIIIVLFLCFGCQNEKKEFKSQGKRVRVSHNGLDNFINKKDFPFYHGVASGDPTQNAVIIWTRVTPKYHQPIKVEWNISTDSNFASIIQKGIFNTSLSLDYTVKIDVQNLKAGKEYYYRFKAENVFSPIGKTKTLPENSENIKLGFASCSNMAWGYFNAYRMMGDDTLDVVIHLGDYIYEHEPGIYDGKFEGRSHIPSKELITLDDYRTRYAQYRLDKDLQYVHSKHPFITIWDDHELSNNAYKDGAGNHQENEGDWQERLAAAKKAYYEWMPIRENKGQHYRSFSFGELANVILLDTRTEDRDKQPESVNIKNIDTNYHIINKKHFDWLKDELNKNHQWKIIGSQIMFSDLKIFFSKSPQLYNDGWSAYRHDKNKLENIIKKMDGVIFVSGDFHSSFDIEDVKVLPTKKIYYFREFVIPSISSANYDEDYGLDSANIYHDWYKKANGNLIYHNLIDHGYFTIELTKEKSISKFKYVNTVKEKDFKPKLQKKITQPFKFDPLEEWGF